MTCDQGAEPESHARMPSPVERAAQFHREGRLDEALAVYAAAVRKDPACHPAWFNMGCARETRGEDAAALECLQHAVAIQPDHPESHHNLGKVLNKLGLVDEAIEEFRTALKLGRAFLPRSAMASLIPAAPGASNQTILEVRRDFARAHLAPAHRARPRLGRTAPSRRLRVGYLSAFFQSPNWMKPVWGLIHGHDRARFEVHLFSTAPADRCPGAEKLHGDDVFHDGSGWTTSEFLEGLEAARLDILVDLNGYSALSLLPVVAARPAPVVVGWFNLYATSGIDAYDFIVGDRAVLPEEEEQFYVEKVLRLPGCYLAFRVDHPAPPVTAPPVLTRNRLTFGSLASSYKITPPVVEAWARILREAPEARLLLKNNALDDPGNAAFLRRRFAACGIPAERIHLEGAAPHFQFLEAYGRVDIALDPFPYNGGTTTEEALWQGVPVLTFCGDRWAARQGASILRAGGMSEWVAAGVEEYVAKAVALAADPRTPGRLAEWRRGLREQLARSSLCDTAALAREMEELYLRMVG